MWCSQKCQCCWQQFLCHGSGWPLPGSLDRLPWRLRSKESTCNTGAAVSIPVLGRSHGGGNGNPLHYSCLECLMDRGTWWATVRSVEKNWTWLKQFNTHARSDLAQVQESLTCLCLATRSIFRRPSPWLTFVSGAPHASIKGDIILAWIFPPACHIWPDMSKTNKVYWVNSDWNTPAHTQIHTHIHTTFHI